MSGTLAPSASNSIWPRDAGSTSTGPIPLGGGPTSLPIVNNTNLPPYNSMNTGAGAPPYNTFNTGIGPPPIPRAPSTPFPSIRPPLGTTTTSISNNYATPGIYPPSNPLQLNLVCVL